MYKDNIWIPVGMVVYAMVAGTLSALGIITLSPGQHLTTAGVFVIITYFLVGITKNRALVGLVAQALVAGILHITTEQQFFASGFYLLIVCSVLVSRWSR